MKRMSVLGIGVLTLACMGWAAEERPPADTGKTASAAELVRQRMAELSQANREQRFVLRGMPHLSVVEKPFYSLTARVNAPQKQTGFDWHADLTREQAASIISHLARDGFLAAAKEWDLRLNTPLRFKTEGYVISVDGAGEHTIAPHRGGHGNPSSGDHGRDFACGRG